MSFVGGLPGKSGEDCLGVFEEGGERCKPQVKRGNADLGVCHSTRNVSLAPFRKVISITELDKNSASVEIPAVRVK
jgi:hypothetical protein